VDKVNEMLRQPLWQCAQLASTFGADLHFPGNGNFTVWDAKQQEVQSACRIEPSTTADVANILSLLVRHQCRFAVKCGGHARYPDDSVSVGGVTIDLAKMRSLDMHPDKNLVSLGAGHNLYSLYTGLERHNLSTTAGRVANVGLGGYALGGGISNSSPKYGMAVDNIFEYEVRNMAIRGSFSLIRCRLFWPMVQS
jgi:FAD/FMN-containing dehydrogenase